MIDHNNYFKPLSVREAERVGDRRKVRAWKRLNWRERIALKIAPWLISQNHSSMKPPEPDCDHDWKQELWDCYCESGADPDGADARHLNPGEALMAVKELRADYGECSAPVGPRPSKGVGLRVRISEYRSLRRDPRLAYLPSRQIWTLAGMPTDRHPRRD
jgi:hypothetical protein